MLTWGIRSLIVTAASRDIDDSVYQEYGSIVSTSTNNELNFSSNSNVKDFDRGITVGLLQLDGDSTIHLRQGSLDIAALQSNFEAQTNKFILGAPLEISSDAPLKTLRESMVNPGSGAVLDQAASGRLSIDASDQSIATIEQKGGLWSYEGDYSSTDISGQGVVVVGDGNEDSESSATFKSIRWFPSASCWCKTGWSAVRHQWHSRFLVTRFGSPECIKGVFDFQWSCGVGCHGR